MSAITISSKFQIVIPRDVREKLHLAPRQRPQVIEKGGVISLVSEIPLHKMKGVLKDLGGKDLREKKDRG